MHKEIVKHSSFRHKLSLAVVLGVVVSIFSIRYLYATSTLPVPSVQLPTLDVDFLGAPNDALDIVYVEDNLETLDQTDPQLIQYTRVRHLAPPSKLPYNLDNKNGSTKDAFSGWVANFFKNTRNGKFIEAGANSGERSSHTLYLEKELEWNGLLVECNPTVVPYLKSKHRKAWVADVCLSPTGHAGLLNFSNPTNWTYSGTLGKPWKLPVPTSWTFFDVPTIPLYTIIAAIGWKEIDYFSFDVEGQELAILKSFPFDLVTFKLIIIEIYFYTEEEKKELDELLRSKGYIFIKNMDIDKIYVHESYKSMIPNVI